MPVSFIPKQFLSFFLGEVSVLIEDYEKLKNSSESAAATSEENMLQDEIKDKLVEEVFELKPNVNTTLVQIRTNQLLHILENQESVIDKIESIDQDKKDEIKQLLKNQVFKEVLTSSNDTTLHNNDESFAKLVNEEKTIEALAISNEDMMRIEDKMESSMIGQTVQNEVEEALEMRTKINHHLKNLTVLETQTKDDPHQMLQKFVQEYVPKPISEADPILEEMNKTQGILKDLQKMNIAKNPEDIQVNLELDALESLAQASEGFPSKATEETEAEKVHYLDQAKTSFFNDSDPLMIDEAANFLKPNMNITSIQDEAELLEHLMEEEIVLDTSSKNLTALEKVAIDTKMEENVVQQFLDYEYHTNQTVDREKRSENLDDLVNSIEEDILEKKYEVDNFDSSKIETYGNPKIKNETEVIDDILEISKTALNDVLNNPETDQVIGDSDKTDALLDEVEKSDLNGQDKDDILEKIKEESLNKAEIAMEDLLGVPNKDPTLVMRKNAIEQEVKDFFHQVDDEETKILQNDTIETLAKMEELESLEDNSKVEVLNNLNAMASILKTTSVKGKSQIQSKTQEKVGLLFDNLVESNLDIKASNLSSTKEVEDKLETEFVNEVMDIVVSIDDSTLNSSLSSTSFQNETEVELKSYMENEFQKLVQLSTSKDEAYKTIEKLEIQERIIQETLQKFPHLIVNQELKTYLSFLTTQYFSQMHSNATKLESFTSYLNGVKTISNSTEEFTQVELKAVPIELNFSRLYFGEIQTIPDHLILVLRNPFITLVSMQMKKAALAAKDYGAYIFHTNAWNNFILNGLKAWYAHTRGWLCSNITTSLLHYEDLTENYSQGNTIQTKYVQSFAVHFCKRYVIESNFALLLL